MNEKLKFCKLLGTNINVITMDETVDYMDQHLDELRGNMSVFPMCIRRSWHFVMQNTGKCKTAV